MNPIQEIYYPFMFFLAIVAAWGVIWYVRSYSKKQTLDASTQANNILDGLVKAQKQEIEKLKADYVELKQRTSELEEKVELLTVQKGDYRDILVDGAQKYFTENPKMAATLLKEKK